MHQKKSSRGTIYKQTGSDIYTIDITYNKRRIRKSTGTSNERKAYVELQKLIDSLENGSYYKEEKSISFEMLSIAYIKEGLPLLKPKTQQEYMTYIHRFFKLIGDKKIINITRDDIQVFVNWIRGRNLSASSILNHLSAISAVFSYGVKTGVTNYNPVTKFDKSYVGKVEKRIRFLVESEYEILLSNCYPLLRKAIILAIETGFRKEELLSLKWNKEQVDFKNREITLWDTKNKEHRTVPISPTALEILKELYENRTCEYVISLNKKRVRDFKRSFKTALKKSNIEDFHWHDLRHTFATWALKGWFFWQSYQFDLYRLQRWLGHKDIKTTQRYAHLETQDLKKLVNY